MMNIKTSHRRMSESVKLLTQNDTETEPDVRIHGTVVTDRPQTRAPKSRMPESVEQLSQIIVMAQQQ